MATTAVIYYCKSHREDVTVAENPRTHLDFNLSRRSFGYLQVLHQLDVSQEVSGREESRESRLSSRVFKVILKPFCCFVRFDYKVKDTERCVWKDVRRLVKTRAKGQSRGHERASEQLQRSMYAGEMKLVFVRINGHQKPHPLACDGIVNADGSISHVWIEKQTLTHIHSR